MTDDVPLPQTKPEVEISDMSDGDVPAVIALWEMCGLTRPWNDPAADLRLAVVNPTSCVLVAWDDYQIVGTVMVGFDGHRGWLYYLAVGPCFRGRGIGRRLVVAAEAWLVAQGAPKLQLMVRASNASVLGFYERLGYTDQDCVVLGRRLDRG